MTVWEYGGQSREGRRGGREEAGASPVGAVPAAARTFRSVGGAEAQPREQKGERVRARVRRRCCWTGPQRSLRARRRRQEQRVQLLPEQLLIGGDPAVTGLLAGSVGA